MPTEPVEPGLPDPSDPPDPPPTPTYPPTITTSSLPVGAIAAAYAATINVINGTAPYAFSISAGALPAGLALNEVTGTVAGIPTASGMTAFIVTVLDAQTLSASVGLSISIPSTPSITNTSLPVGTVGIVFLAGFQGQGGAQPYGFHVTSGSIPPGLVLAATGGFTGTPTVAGTYTFTVQVYDSNSPQGTGSSPFSITIQSSSISNPITTMDEVVLIASPDGAIYSIVPGQRFDEDYDGNPVGINQAWQGVPGSSSKLALMQLGGASVSAKGVGQLYVTATDDDGKVTRLSKDARPMMLQGGTLETKRDFKVVGVPKSERFGIGLTNGAVVGSWFEVHVAILWVRTFLTGRKG